MGVRGPSASLTVESFAAALNKQKRMSRMGQGNFEFTPFTVWAR